MPFATTHRHRPPPSSAGRADPNTGGEPHAAPLFLGRNGLDRRAGIAPQPVPFSASVALVGETLLVPPTPGDRVRHGRHGTGPRRPCRTRSPSPLRYRAAAIQRRPSGKPPGGCHGAAGARLARFGPALRPPLATHRPCQAPGGHRARPVLLPRGKTLSRIFPVCRVARRASRTAGPHHFAAQNRCPHRR